MLNKLTLRNVNRSARDYLIYVVTMTIVSTLMFALHGMIFSENIQALYQEFSVFGLFMGLGSFFVILIIVWLVHYMVRFMMERRSREFGTYLLLGMKKKEIARIFRRENLLLGVISIILGILPGLFFQIAFTNIFYSVLDVDLRITPEISLPGLLLTSGLLLAAYMLALHRVKRNFRRMNIHDFIYLDKKNEQVKQETGSWKGILSGVSVIYIVVFNILALTGRMTIISVWIYTGVLIAAIYLLYAGLSAVFISRLKKGSAGTYKNANIFIFRQLASKIRTMRFTMGTLTILFTVALLGWTVVMMLGDYHRTELKKNMPFDIILFSDRPDDTFEEQADIIRAQTDLEDSYIYQIYENGTDVWNRYLYEQIDGTYTGETAASGRIYTATYFACDTYIRLSDYNYIRSMLGYEEIVLEDGRYLIHGKERIADVLQDGSDRISVSAGGRSLVMQELRTEPLCQNGMNGADYLIVAADEEIAGMRPLYSLYAAMTDGDISPDSDLQQRLEAVVRYAYDEELAEYEYDIQWGYGSDNIISFNGTVIVREIASVEGSFILVSTCYMLAYIGIVFLCAALTILTIQQLSDSSKYRFRYTVLKNLGLNKRDTDKIVLKQLLVYFLCPFIIAVVLSMFLGLAASERFVYFTGVHAGMFQYYILSVLIFAVLYLAYFGAAYIGFLRNIHK